jgi:hypothetical protein
MSNRLNGDHLRRDRKALLAAGLEPFVRRDSLRFLRVESAQPCAPASTGTAEPQHRISGRQR